MNFYPPSNTSITSSFSREETVSPSKDPVEHVRITEQRVSPKEHDLPTAARESPKTRERPQPSLASTSPSSATFALQNLSHTPENRGSPYRAGTTLLRIFHTILLNLPLLSLPPSAAFTRGPDKSLPLQEEGEDDTHLLDHPPRYEFSGHGLLTSDESGGRFDGVVGGSTTMGSARPRPRSGVTDQLGLRGMEALMEPNGTGVPTTGPNISNMSGQALPQIVLKVVNSSSFLPRIGSLRLNSNSNSKIIHPNSCKIHTHNTSTTGDTALALIPPTPHSQSAAPAPSLLMMAGHDYRNNRDMPLPAHIPHPTNNSNANANANGAGGAGAGGEEVLVEAVPTPHDQALLRDQYAKQWQIYAQNNTMSDYTFSPAPTPFQGAYMPWAYHHTRRMFGGPGAMSMQSSPSHEPVPLPSRLPSHLTESKLRREASGLVSPPRKPPPRVENTQPRDTSPGPSSSGKETAGEDSYPIPQSRYQGYDERWAGAIVPIGGEEADDDGVDEDEEVDLDDLLELEYHSSYARRRWEIGWGLPKPGHTNGGRITGRFEQATYDLLSIYQANTMHQLKAAFRGVAQHRRQTLEMGLTAEAPNPVKAAVGRGIE
ncbi:hypothetical protein M378DRAFT_17500 [Amanita muscaria Koide BX008]|uniref:Uncharacterized protein n=1 Tax=Amanita muscaria (strain Koide BX008) TaxID=946122 RepID=A0A0C2RZX8_AMAMK|nr:hypothetical protein M378DRAFT_17500 [Amanita muscaria Koide BX008]